jgi:hypothetical protein
MENRIRLRWGIYGAAVSLATLASGCALTATIQVTPVVGTPGQPVTYLVTITNPAACTLTSPELIFAPLIQRNSEVDALCSAVQNPALVLCENVDPTTLPPDIVAECCTDPTFAMDNSALCTGDARSGMSGQSLEQEAESVLSSHPVTTAAIVAAAEATGAAVSCNFNGTFFDCLLDDIPAGQSETVTFTVTPSVGGSFANFAIAGGTLACESSRVPFGSACADTTVTTTAPAPTLSHGGIAASLILLAMIAAWRMRALHRRKSRLF